MHNVSNCLVAWKSGRKLQIIPDKHERDHFPLLLFLHYKLEFPQSPPAADERISWDIDKLNECVQTGKHRTQFLQDLSIKLQEDKEKPDYVDSALAAAKANERVAGFIAGKEIKKEIYVSGKIVNIVAV
jgi:hypothetical protein